VTSPARPPQPPDDLKSLIDAVLQDGRSDDALRLLQQVADSALSEEDREALDALGPDLVRQVIAEQQGVGVEGRRLLSKSGSPSQAEQRDRGPLQEVLAIARSVAKAAGWGSSAPEPSFLDHPPARPVADVSAAESLVRQLLARGGDAASLDPPTPGTVRAGCTGAQPPGETPAFPAEGVRGYELLRELGRGGMGVVYKARDTRLNRVVALKMIRAGGHADDGQRQRFRVEAEAVAGLQHPNIVQIYEVGEANGQPFFTLEFVPGGSLAARLDGIPFPPMQAARLAEQLAAGVHSAHRQGVIHRDLKPANVLLTADGTPKITDFGLAKRLESGVGQTASGAVMGTPSYMAPEQAQGKAGQVGPPADVYALGAILYECLTGRPPFRATTQYDTLLQVMSQEPVPVRRLQPKCPRDLETITLKCLAKEPHKRYASAADLAHDLGQFLGGKPVLARPVPAWERAWKWGRRRPTVASMVVLSSLLAITAAAALGWRAECLRLSNDLAAARRENESLRGHLRHAVGEQELSVAKLRQLAGLARGEGAPPGLQWLRQHPDLRSDLDRLGELLVQAAEQSNRDETDHRTLAEIARVVDRLRDQFAVRLDNPAGTSPPSAGEEADIRLFFYQIEEQVVWLRRSGKAPA
jgi:hypothetical protein